MILSKGEIAYLSLARKETSPRSHDVMLAVSRLPAAYREDIVAMGPIRKMHLGTSAEEIKRGQDMVLLTTGQFRQAFRMMGGEVLVDLNQAGNWIEETPGFVRKAEAALAPQNRVSAEVHSKRMMVCEACSFWQRGETPGSGRCQKCGCSGAKQWLANSECPIQLWGKELPAE